MVPIETGKSEVRHFRHGDYSPGSTLTPCSVVHNQGLKYKDPTWMSMSCLLIWRGSCGIPKRHTDMQVYREAELPFGHPFAPGRWATTCDLPAPLASPCYTHHGGLARPGCRQGKGARGRQAAPRLLWHQQPSQKPDPRPRATRPHRH